jgi:hypothetical protein
MPWSMSCYGANTSNATPAPALPRTACTASSANRTSSYSHLLLCRNTA